MSLPLNGWHNGTNTTGRKRNDGLCWKDFWLQYTKRNSFGKCSVNNCNNDAEVGAHVWNESEAVRRDDGRYIIKNYRIVPMCKECNKRETGFLLKDSTNCPIESFD